ncbi:DUF3795 domain-containing protein [Zongyangia hominis]|uniref:DUF3795 domain-containing protein n=1 Tax=Zongyangia hominis TaxID=2763677 RepID=A0A926EER2_9FIRM|nr:DUF3795 domain-containing protein [Zongyangia hominis]MBC8570726.1 DUF3795 domain-containing protein [Zongyangia hominis]
MTLDDQKDLAPCGVFCGACYAHLRKRKPCGGCRGRAEEKAAACRKCRIAECARERKVIYCGECGAFPCPPLRALDRNYRRRYGLSPLDTGVLAGERGARFVLEMERRRWTCPDCGGVICLHDRTCSLCGYHLPAEEE